MILINGVKQKYTHEIDKQLAELLAKGILETQRQNAFQSQIE